jgi:hypothetical protein
VNRILKMRGKGESMYAIATNAERGRGSDVVQEEFKVQDCYSSNRMGLRGGPG